MERSHQNFIPEHCSIFNRQLTVYFAIVGWANHKQVYSLEGGDAGKSHMVQKIARVVFPLFDWLITLKKKW